MINLDTNVLVRFLVRDDAEQTERARALVVRAVETGRACFVSDIVLCELVWVLTRAYRLPRHEIVPRLRALLVADHTAFSSRDRVWRALDAFETRGGDFADYLLHETGLGAGCTETATFDAALLSEPGFSAP